MKKGNNVSRRYFIGGVSAAGLAFGQGCASRPVPIAKFKSPNEKLNIAAIGAGGKGHSDIKACGDLGENVVALCDPDWDRAAKTFELYPNAKRFKDYREMFDTMGNEIDACTISTPDHTHAPAAYRAMMEGKHVYVQKPLTHTVAEARLLTNVARETGVATQMGNQGHSGDGIREMCEMVWSGAIGDVTEAHIWTSRPVWPQGIEAPLPKQPIPGTMDWDLWIGSAPMRDYNEAYAPFKWRGWLDFGGGALGDMACHIMDACYWGLELREAKELTVELKKVRGRNEQTFPKSTIIKYSFPERKTPHGKMAAVDVYWYDGAYSNEKGPVSSEVRQYLADNGIDEKLGDGANGSLFIGTGGALTTGEYGGKTRLLPAARMEDYQMPEQVIPRIEDENPYLDWINACKGQGPASSNFDYSGPFTEMVNFGNLAVKSGKPLIWDNKRGRVKNVENPEEIVSKEYRKGWELPVAILGKNDMPEEEAEMS